VKGALAVAGALVALALLSSAAGASTGNGGWVITNSSGNTFSGTFTNETASPINGVAVGTADKAANPITAFTINAIVCQLYANYGSAYCYTALLIQPGATVLFHGTSQKALPPAGLQMCTSADRGMDNTCSDVALAKAKAQATKSKKSKATSTISDAELRKRAAGRAFEDALKALDGMATAVEDVNKGDTRGALHVLINQADSFLVGALSQNFDAADISGDLRSALQDVRDAQHELISTKPGKLSRVRKLLDAARGKTHSTALDLNHMSHS
jgi:hypothetical protein